MKNISTKKSLRGFNLFETSAEKGADAINTPAIKAPISKDKPAYLNNEEIHPLTFEEAQTLLDLWIDEENENPELDQEGNPIIQQKINLSIWVL